MTYKASYDKFINTLGEDDWDSNWEAVQQLSPRFFSASIDLLAVPKTKRHLSPKVQQLIAIAVNSSSTHLYLPGIHQHIKLALKAGASEREVMEVIELTSTLGIHACNLGVPLLVDVMKEVGIWDNHPYAGKPLSPRCEALKEDFTKRRGYWHSTWEEFLVLDPDFFQAYLNFSSIPWENDTGGGLEPKIKELIYCAFDAAATHLYAKGLRLHMVNVLKYGGTPEEILEVLEIATQLSLHTAHAAAPILCELTRID